MVRDSRKIAAILAADVVDYSRLMGADEAGTLEALAIRRGLFDILVKEFDGSVFGSVGDSLMAEFASAVNAVQCAQAIQDRIANENAALPPGRRMRLRIGVNLGDVIESAGATAGDAVNVAARLQALAKPGGVLISGAVHEQVRHKIPARFIDTGERQVKNIREPVRSFAVLPAAAPGIGGRIAAAFARIASPRVVRAAAIGGALGVALGLGLFWRELPVPATGRTLGALLDPGVEAPPANSIAVLPFVNLSGDAGNDYLGDGLAEELTHRLARIPGMRVAARTSAFAYRGREINVQEIADTLGVGYIVEGSIKRQGDRLRVNAALVERTSGANRWSDSYESSSRDFFAIEEDIGAQVLAALEIVLESQTGRPATAAVRGSVAAYDYFLQGLAYLRQPKSDQTLDAARQLFERALAEQPDFGRAQAGICELHVERYALRREPALVAAAEKACARAQALDSTAQEVHEAVGRLRLATGDAAEAEAAYRQALAIVPHSPDALIGLAAALAAGGRTQQAEITHRRAIESQPRYAATHIAYGNFLAAQGRLADAIAPFERATVLAPDNPSAFNNLGGAHLFLGAFDKAADAFARSLAIEPRRASYSNAGSSEYYRGRFRAAAAMYRKAIELAPADHRLWGNLGDAMRFESEGAAATEAYRQALLLAEQELAINPRHAVNRAHAAYYASRVGDEDRVRAFIAQALTDGEDSYYVHYYVALAELGLGNESAALKHAKRARQLGYPEALLRAAPELGDIRNRM